MLCYLRHVPEVLRHWIKPVAKVTKFWSKKILSTCGTNATWPKKNSKIRPLKSSAIDYRLRFMNIRWSCDHIEPAFTQIYWNKTKGLHKKRVQFPKDMVWDTNMAAVSFFWDTNMAAVTPCENTLLWLVCSKNRCLLRRISWNFGILILVEVTANKLLRDGVDPFVSATLTLMIMWSQYE